MVLQISTRLKSVKQNYLNLSPPVKASLWFTICSILQKGVSLLSIPIFTRLLTTSQYGTYSVYQSWYDVIKLFATLNLYAGVFYNGMIKFKKDKNRFVSCIQGLSTTITCILFILYLSNIKFWNNIFQLPTIFIITMFVDLIFSTSLSFWTSSERFNYSYKKLIMVTLFIAIASPLLGICAVMLTNYKAEARIITFAFVQIVVGIILYINIMKKGRSFFDKLYWKYALKFNIPLLPHFLSLVILQQSDRIMISRIVGEDKAAIYSVAYSISTIMVIITTAIDNSLVPYTYKSLENKEYSNIYKSINKILLFVAFICVGVMAFAPEVVKFFATPAYYDAIWIIPPVAASVYYMFLYQIFSNVSLYYEANKFVMIASCVGSVLNVILNFILIPKFGFVAAGYTTLICYMMFGIAHYICYKIVLKNNVDNKKIYDIKGISIISALMLFIMIIMLFIYKCDIIRYLIILALIIVLSLKYKTILKQINEFKGKNNK